MPFIPSSSKTASSAGLDVQSFTASGTWTKPSSGTMALIMLWGGGGAGGRAGSGDWGGGGGGGAYTELLIRLSLLGSTEAVTIGAGGASRTSDEQDGPTGGNSTFGSWLTAYGGGGGEGATAGAGSGGGGGGQGSAGTVGTVDGSTPGVGGNTLYGVTAANELANIGAYVSAGATGDGSTPKSSVYGGGDGGRGSVTGVAGGTSRYGGGGGGGCQNTSSTAGGDSLVGGDGGAGGVGAGTGTAGTQPAGGGGGSATGNSGAGGDGMCIVVVF